MGKPPPAARRVTSLALEVSLSSRGIWRRIHGGAVLSTVDAGDGGGGLWEANGVADSALSLKFTGDETCIAEQTSKTKLLPGTES